MHLFSKINSFLCVMSHNSKFNALAAVKMMTETVEEDNENEEQDDLSAFLNVSSNEATKPLRSILKRKDILINDKNQSDLSEIAPPDKKKNLVANEEVLVKAVDQHTTSTANADTRIVLKMSGLPFDAKSTEVVGFLGVWPSDGYDGVKIICDWSGEPAGYAYILVDNFNDAKRAKQSSGIKFRGKAVTVTNSSMKTMEIEWTSTLRVLKQIKKSPFVRLGNLPFTMSKKDILRLLSKYRRESEDVYCWSDKPDEENTGYCYVIMDNCKEATKLCRTALFWKNQKLLVHKFHPEVLSQWCRRNEIQFVVRDSIKYDISINDALSDDSLDNDFSEKSDSEFNETITGSPSNIVVYDPNNMDEMDYLTPGSDKNQSNFSRDEIERNSNEKEYNHIQNYKNRPSWSPRNAPPRFPDGPGHPLRMPFGPREFPFRPPFHNHPFPPRENFRFGFQHGPMPPHPRGMGPFRPALPPNAIPNPIGPPHDQAHVRFPNNDANFPRPMPDQMLPHNQPDLRFPINNPNFPQPRPDQMPPNSPGLRFPLNDPNFPRSMPDHRFPVNRMESHKQSRPHLPGPYGPQIPPGMHPGIHPRPPGFMEPFRPPFLFGPRNALIPSMGRPRLGFVPTVYLRVYDVPSKAMTNDVKDFFLPIVPLKIAQNIGTDVYDVEFNKPDDALNSLNRDGAALCGKVVKVEMLVSPRVPLPKDSYSKDDRAKKDYRNKKDFKRKKDPTFHSDPVAKKSDKHQVKVPVSKESSIEVPPFPDDPLEYELKPFDPEMPAGQCAIQPMKGYFCKICGKFYKSQTTVLASHCKSKQHYDNVKAFIEKARSANSKPDDD